MKIVIPKNNIHPTIKKGSGIVMKPLPKDVAKKIPGVALFYYEGNLYNSSNLNKYEQRIICAAGRAHTKYPTVACHTEYEKNFIVVGWIEPELNYDIGFYDNTNDIIKEWTCQHNYQI